MLFHNCLTVVAGFDCHISHRQASFFYFIHPSLPTFSVSSSRRSMPGTLCTPGHDLSLPLYPLPDLTVCPQGANTGDLACGPACVSCPHPVLAAVPLPYNVTLCVRRVANTEDPTLHVGLPVYTIHGNHDDPSGADNLSAVDILSSCGLVNYFGKVASEESPPVCNQGPVFAHAAFLSHSSCHARLKMTNMQRTSL